MSESERERTPDAELVGRATAGDLASFEELMARYERAVFNIAYYKSRNCFDAEDLSQDVFLAAFKALPTLRDPNNFGHWLYGIAYNRCHKWYHRERNKVLKFQELRRYAEQEERVARLAGTRRPAAGGEEEPVLSDLMARLPEDVRNVLKMKYLEGLSYQEIQARLGIKPHRIDYLIRKGKKALREQWKRQSGETGDIPG